MPNGRREPVCAGRPLLLVAAGLVVGTGCAGLPGGERSPRVYWPGDVDVPPDLIACGRDSEPATPSPGDARTVRVIVRFVVTPRGEVLRPTVTDGDPEARRPGILERAVEAARGCRYEPARLDGEPVAVRWRHYFVFDGGG